MSTLGFDSFVEPLKIYLQKYREVCCLLLLSTCLIAKDRQTMYTVQSRDVTKFEFDIVQTSNVFNRFEIWRMFQVFCCRMRIHGKNPCSTTDFMCTESQRAQTNLFFFLSNSTYYTNYSYWICNTTVMCYTVLIWSLFLLTSGNNILLWSFQWPELVHYFPTDKMNASIRIRIIS